MLEDEVEKVWTESELGETTKRRQGWRDYLIATGPAPTMVSGVMTNKIKFDFRDAKSRVVVNSIKHSCCKKICSMIKADITMALISPSKYVRDFAQQMVKSKESK